MLHQKSRRFKEPLLHIQFVRAGVGNIYRAEILYKTGLHPEQPGHTVDRDTYEVGGGVEAGG
jgi:endonuclease-8